MMQRVAALAALSDDELDERAMDDIPALVPVLSASSTTAIVARAVQRVLHRMASTCSPREVVLALLASCGGGGATLRASARVAIVSLLSAALARVRQRRRAPLLRDTLDAIASFVCDGPAAERAPWEADDPPHVAALALALCSLHRGTADAVEPHTVEVSRACAALLLALLPAIGDECAADGASSGAVAAVVECLLRCAARSGVDGAQLLALKPTTCVWVDAYLPTLRARALSLGCVAHTLLSQSTSLWALPAVVAPARLVALCAPLAATMLGGGGSGARTTGGSCCCDASRYARLAARGVELLDAVLRAVPPASLTAPVLEPREGQGERGKGARGAGAMEELDGAGWNAASVAACCVPLIEHMVTADAAVARRAAYGALQRTFDALHPRRRLTLLRVLARRSPRPVVTALILDRARAECLASIRGDPVALVGGIPEVVVEGDARRVFDRRVAVTFIVEGLSLSRDPIDACEVYTSALNLLRLLLLFGRARAARSGAAGGAAGDAAGVPPRVAPLLKALAQAVDARGAQLDAEVDAAREGRRRVRSSPSSPSPLPAAATAAAAGSPFVVDAGGGSDAALASGHRLQAAERRQRRLELVQEVLSRVRELL